jgi:hypothetical protein
MTTRGDSWLNVLNWDLFDQLAKAGFRGENPVSDIQGKLLEEDDRGGLDALPDPDGGAAGRGGARRGRCRLSAVG